MQTVYYKSDFDFILELKDCRGMLLGVPEHDWIAKFYTTTKLNSYVASSIGGVLTNCFIDNGQIHVVMNNHGLGPGELQFDFIAELPDGKFPDGNRRLVNTGNLDIELTTDCDCQCETGGNVGQHPDSPARLNKGAEINAALTRGIQRGMISLGAEPGLIYRNRGYIRVPPRGSRTKGHLFWKEPQTLDISNVDPKLIIGPYCRVRNKEAQSLVELNPELTKLYTKGVSGEDAHRVMVRLKIRTVSVFQKNYTHLMKFSDGIIRGFWLETEPYERNVPKRIIIKRENFGEVNLGLREVLHHFGIFEDNTVSGGIKVDVEYKAAPGGDQCKWRRNVRTIRYSKAENRFVPTLRGRAMGVVRFRIARGRRRRAGEWAIFSYLCRKNFTRIIPL